MAFRIIRNDITRVAADAVVNTANPLVAVGSGMDAAIYEAAGREKLLKARGKIGELEPGEVGITPAFGLSAKYIIHSSGPMYVDGKHGEAEILRQCYDKALKLARRKRCRSIAFPLMASGAYGFPEELGLKIAVGAFTEFLLKHEMEITLVVFGSSSYKVSGRLFGEVQSFIDDRYAGEREAKARRYGGTSELLYREMPVNALQQPENVSVTMSADDGGADDGSVDMPMPELMRAVPPLGRILDAPVPKMEKGTGDKWNSLEEHLKEVYKNSFSKHLQQLINKKGLKNSEVYGAANISKQYFSKLLKGQVNPSKEKVLALAVGLRLNWDEAVDFLRFAGYAFSPVSQVDAVVEFFLREREYSVIKIDIMLFDYGLPTLSE